MNFSNYEWLAAVIGAHSNQKLQGRTRLQKEMKLLQRLEMPVSYIYSIHFYGPYSEDLQSDIGLLKEFGLVVETEEKSESGITTYTFELVGNPDLPPISNFQSAIDRMSNAESTILELAATYDTFRTIGSDHEEALERLRIKKGTKCNPERENQALKLLEDLELIWS